MLPIVQFSMTNHSADPNQKISRADPKFNSCYGTDPEKRSKQMQKSKEFFYHNRSVFILKLTTPKQIPIFKVSTVRGSLKIRRGSENFDADPELFLYKTCGFEVPHWYKA
jgi:hypothetical protein